MYGICGWLGDFRSGASPARVLDQMSAGLTQAGFKHCSKSTSQAGLHVRGGYSYIDNEIWAAVEGDPFWSSPKLADSPDQGNPAATLALAYRLYDKDLLQHLHGPFALAVLNIHERRALLAIDRMGIHPLCYAIAGDNLIFGSTTASLAAHPSITSSIDPQSIFDYTYFHMVPSPETIYKQQRKLLPGQCVQFVNGHPKIDFYWQPVFRDEVTAPVEELHSRLHRLLSTSVQRCCRDRKTGSFLSGGVDSSTISGVLARVNQRPAKTYSIGFDVAEYNEIDYVRITAKHFRTKQSEYYVTPEDVIDAVPRVARFYDEPFGNPSAISVYYCSRMAKEDGIDLLLAGDGGDEVFAGHIRYARQKLFGVYSWLPPVLRSSLLEPAIFHFPGGDRITAIQKARSYIKHASTAMPERREIYNFLHRAKLGEIFQQDFLASINLCHPLMLLQDVYSKTEGENALNRFLHLDWKFTLADDDLRKVNRMCELAGVNVRYPLLDDDLVEFSTQLPHQLKLKNLKLRYFFKCAMKDFLPAETLAKSKHGFGLPFNLWLHSSVQLRELACDSIHDLKKRNYFQLAFLDNLTRQYKSARSSSAKEKVFPLMMEYLIEQGKPEPDRDFGDMIWILMMLELWLQARN